MLIKEFSGKDTGGKTRVFAEVKCDVCCSTFTRQKRRLKEHVCTRMCGSILKGTTIELVCDHCTSPFVRAKNKLQYSKSGKYFCSRECKDSAQKYMVEIQPDHYGTGTGVHSYREKALASLTHTCVRCGYNNNINALEVHHKDKNRDNNDISNLEILCANCHRIEHLGD